MFLHDPQHTGRSPYRGPQEGKVEWLFDAGRTIFSSPAIDAEGNIYFTGLQADFFCVNPSGTALWKMEKPQGDSNPTIASDGTIYVFGDTTLYAFAPGGTLKWKKRVQLVYAAVGTASPAISRDGNLIIVPQIDLVAFRPDGSTAWRLQPDADDPYGFQYGPAFSPDGSTVYANGGTKLYAVDTGGTVKWRFAGQTSSVAVDNAGNLYFASGYINFYSLTPDGSVRWTYSNFNGGGFDVGPTIGQDGTIYVAGGYLYAFDYVGKLKWKFELPSGSGSIPAIDVDGTVYVGRNTSRTAADSVNFIALHPNGTVKFQLCLRSPDGTVPDIDSRPAISGDGKIYVGSDYPHGFHLYKVR
jgi:sugar lactone lactonase YvrE